MNNRPYDLASMRFGRLLAVERVQSLNGRDRWRCLCDCGNEKLVLSQNLRNGHVQSCGCLSSEKKRERFITYNASIGREIHGETLTRLYKIYIGIKSRCCDKNHRTFSQYGGRGISICAEWLDSYITFRDWSIANGYSDKLSIDRIDPDGDYSPQNCRWASSSTQNYNKRRLARNTSGHVGVSYNKKEGKYVAYISKDHKLHWLGTFETYDLAVDARKRAELDLWGQQSPISR